MGSYFEKAAPESVDIRAEGITGFLEAVEKKGLELHSLMVIRHGRCCAAGWYAPYREEALHPVYSFSKSLTATAIGFACQEGLLSLEDKLVELLPEYSPENPSENLKQVTLHHLLTMSCGQETEPDTRSAEWISEFMNHPFPHRPGTWYQYNTAGTNMLSAVLTKKAGMSLLDYLGPRLLQPLGIEDIFCHRMADSMHTCHGGGGMKLTTEGMARFTYFMLRDGEWEGRKLLPGWYREKAAVKQIETAGDAEGHVKEWAKGYGYQCWMCSLPDSFRADGAFGQFGFVFPTLDLIVVMTSGTEQTQTLVDCMYETLIPAVLPDGALKSEKRTDLESVMSGLRLPGLLSCKNPFMEREITRGVYTAEHSQQYPKMNSLEMLIGGAGLLELTDETQITRMRFSFEENRLLWTVLDGGEEKCIAAALDGSFADSHIGGFIYAATAKWRSLHALEMQIRRIDAISGVQLIFRFEDGRVTIEAEDTLITAGGLGMTQKQLVPFVKQEDDKKLSVAEHDAVRA